MDTCFIIDWTITLSVLDKSVATDLYFTFCKTASIIIDNFHFVEQCLFLFFASYYLLISPSLFILIPPSVGRVSFPYDGSLRCFRASSPKQAAGLLQAEQLPCVVQNLTPTDLIVFTFRFWLPCLLCLLIDSFYGIVF